MSPVTHIYFFNVKQENNHERKFNFLFTSFSKNLRPSQTSNWLLQMSPLDGILAPLR